MYYCKPVFTRGSGLGNRLFPWARCRIFSSIHQIPMLAPKWFTGRIGSLIRGGIDLNYYAHQILLLDLFEPRDNDVKGLNRSWIDFQSTKISEPENLLIFNTRSQEKMVVCFQGDKKHFADLRGWESYLLDELKRISKSKWINLVDQFGEIPIAINIRMGNDFKTAKTPEEYYTKGGIKTPLSWFIDSLNTIRDSIGYSAQAYIVSDGNTDNLDPILSLPNVTFVRPGCAISDLLILAKAKILIASGGSSFSAWASFLGQMPTISHPGQSLSWFQIDNIHNYYVGEFNPEQPSSIFIEQSKNILSR